MRRRRKENALERIERRRWSSATAPAGTRSPLASVFLAPVAVAARESMSAVPFSRENSAVGRQPTVKTQKAAVGSDGHWWQRACTRTLMGLVGDRVGANEIVRGGIQYSVDFQRGTLRLVRGLRHPSDDGMPRTMLDILRHSAFEEPMGRKMVPSTAGRETRRTGGPLT